MFNSPGMSSSSMVWNGYGGTELCIVDVLCLYMYSTYTQWPHDESTEAEVHIL